MIRKIGQRGHRADADAGAMRGHAAQLRHAPERDQDVRLLLPPLHLWEEIGAGPSVCQRASTVRLAAALSSTLRLANACSTGFRSGG